MSKVYTVQDDKCNKREHTFQISGGNDESSKNKSRRIKRSTFPKIRKHLVRFH